MSLAKTAGAGPLRLETDNRPYAPCVCRLTTDRFNGLLGVDKWMPYTGR
jgi:hypothetical protein